MEAKKVRAQDLRLDPKKSKFKSFVQKGKSEEQRPKDRNGPAKFPGEVPCSPSVRKKKSPFAGRAAGPFFFLPRGGAYDIMVTISKRPALCGER